MDKVALLALFAFILNLPFGYFRSRTRRYSLKWLLYIHVPIAFIIAARLLSQVEFSYVPLLIVATIAGQICGGKLTLN